MNRTMETLESIEPKSLPSEIRLLFIPLRSALRIAHSAGHTQGPLNPNVNGLVAFHKFSWDNRDWVVHAACHADVLLNFLFDAIATPDAVGIVAGPRGAKKLGINGKPIENLQVYLKT
mgnify:CR=1 FL=1